MNKQRFEFQNKDIPFLKRDIAMRLAYVALFCFTFVLQIIMLIIDTVNNKATTTSMAVGCTVLVCSLLFAIISFSFAFKDIKQIDVINKTGFVVSSVSILPNTEKGSFIKVYSFLVKLISIVMLCVFAGFATYSILQYIHFSTVSANIPLLFFITICSFNSVYHVKHEIQLTETVNLYNSAY